MATQFYLTGQAPRYTPPTIRGSWNITTSSFSGLLDSSKLHGGNITSLSLAEAVSTNPYSRLLYRGITGKLAAQTLSGTLDIRISLTESNTAADMYTHLHVYVTQGDSDTVRGTLIDNYVEDTTNEWGTAVTTGGKALTAAQAISLAISEGDRIVIEIGYVARNSVATSHSGFIRYGTISNFAAANDMTVGGNGDSLAPFILFSNDVAEYTDDIAIRNTQMMLKVLDSHPTSIRNTQMMLKVLDSHPTSIRSSQMILKVLRSTSSIEADSNSNNMIVGCWL
jgi:hypothetical protein